jgi:hypothetical protein
VPNPELLNYREFEAGPDPFGRKYQVWFKWLQTAITLRHSDTVDVKFILTDDSGRTTEKTIALPHPELLQLSRDTGRPLEDPWCARIAGAHLLHLIQTGEDIEKDLVTVTREDLKRHANEVLTPSRV